MAAQMPLDETFILSIWLEVLVPIPPEITSTYSRAESRFFSMVCLQILYAMNARLN